MRKVSTRRKKHLLKLFPYISNVELSDEYECEIERYYNVFAVSIFGRWLSEEEADCFLAEYLWQGNYTDSHSNYKASEDKYLSFMQELSHLDDIYFFVESLGLEKLSTLEFVLYKAETQADLEKICLANIREESFFRLFLPKLHIAIRGNFDMTQIVYFTKKSNLDRFVELVEKCQLHILK